MTVLFQTNYAQPYVDYPLTHSRIAHSGNWLDGGTVVASTTAAGFFDVAPLNSLTYEFWKPTTVPATWEYDHGSSAANVDYCAISAHKLGTNGVTLSVQYWNGTTWTTLINDTPITSDAPIFCIFAPTTAQRFRIGVSVGSPAKIGCIRFGTAMQMARPMFAGHSPFSWSRNTVLRMNNSNSGEFLGRTKQRVSRDTSFAWKNLPYEWVQSEWVNFQRAAEAEPFWLAWRPDNYPDVGYCQIDEVPIPQFSGVRNLADVSMNVRVRGYD